MWFRCYAAEARQCHALRVAGLRMVAAPAPFGELGLALIGQKKGGAGLRLTPLFFTAGLQLISLNC